MAKKKLVRTAPAPAVAQTAPKAAAAATTDVLLDWRFNLIVIGCMEVLLILFALPREVARYRQNEAQKALWRGQYARAFRLYYQIDRDDPNNPGILKALGDAALGRGQYQLAMEYYARAANQNYSPPEMKIQMVRIYRIALQSEKDPKMQALFREQIQMLMDRAVQEGPNDLKVNFWMGQFAVESGDLVRAADYFSRARADALPPGGKPNEEQQRLIAEAQKILSQIQSVVFKDADYRLDLTGLQILSTPTVMGAVPPPTVMETSAPAVLPTPGPTSPSLSLQSPAPIKTPTVVPTPSAAPTLGTLQPSAPTPTPAAVRPPTPSTTPAPAPTPAITPAPKATPSPPAPTPQARPSTAPATPAK